MPTIEIIEGVKINIYPNEHPPPHFHTIYGEHEALIRITDLEIDKGNLPTKHYKKVKNWAKNHQNELGELFKHFNPDL